jgi:hypothetical protein
LAVGEEGPDTEVVGADPDGVDGRAGAEGRGEERFGGSGVDACGGRVGEVGGDFVFEDAGEVGVDAGEPSCWSV